MGSCDTTFNCLGSNANLTAGKQFPVVGPARVVWVKAAVTVVKRHRS